jgi:nucleoside 2-deoxyribosyltransferase
MLFYLAHPYSGKAIDPEQRKEEEIANVDDTNKIAALLLKQGLMVYSPLSETHPIHLQGVSMDLWPENEWELYLSRDERLMEKCDALILCPGWEESRGCLRERDYFTESGKPIFILEDILQES